MDNNVYPLFVLFQNKIFGNIYMNKIYVYKNRLYQIEFKKFQFDTAPSFLINIINTSLFLQPYLIVPMVN
ncbi:hypothetical protein ClosIBUN22A_CONTIG62g01198 [Clostridium sp. IBUN22A]|nr:hypothetical protein ClosIBUN125C_CONTIG57g03169 [Clostridium sp. IBUN125C]KJZ86637.1 hypothetical protein ClosIBUN22A_CONTIG62g01198 [Clostridium sp. IBUN22A]